MSSSSSSVSFKFNNNNSECSSPFSMNIKTCQNCEKNYKNIPNLSWLKCSHSMCLRCIFGRFREGLEPCAFCLPKITKKYKCCEENCESLDIEKNLNICSTCTPQKSLENLEQLLSVALCSTCAMRKHLRNSHEIIDFSPSFAKFQSLSMSKILKRKIEENSDSDFFPQKFEDLKNREKKLIEKCLENLEKTESPTEQQDLFEKIEVFLEKLKKARNRMTLSIDNENLEISKNIDEFWKENLKDEEPPKKLLRK
ncbi:unnamed protein product [Caenorhabditis angaria]|uniref:RING-type domain-containing protein n=1 Tax=Caenorhabditis angaria TaxID=860376 RepID=A0A9P1I748_9PELO|nr:unnamed protein product [Caenorhabditis angaria]